MMCLFYLFLSHGFAGLFSVMFMLCVVGFVVYAQYSTIIGNKYKAYKTYERLVYVKFTSYVVNK